MFEKLIRVDRVCQLNWQRIAYSRVRIAVGGGCQLDLTDAVTPDLRSGFGLQIFFFFLVFVFDVFVDIFVLFVVG